MSNKALVIWLQPEALTSQCARCRMVQYGKGRSTQWPLLRRHASVHLWSRCYQRIGRRIYTKDAALLSKSSSVGLTRPNVGTAFSGLKLLLGVGERTPTISRAAHFIAAWPCSFGYSPTPRCIGGLRVNTVLSRLLKGATDILKNAGCC